MFSATAVIVSFSTILTTVLGQNELFEAIERGNESAVVNLIEWSFIKTLFGIPAYDVNLRDNALKLTPLEYAIERRKGNIAEILMKKGAKDRPLEKAIDAGLENVARLMLEDTGVDVNEEIPFKFGLLECTTFLHEAVRGKNAAIVKMLCDKGADLEKINFSDFTPLQCAVHTNAGAEIVRILLEAGADVNGMNSSKHTALHFAASYHKNKRIREIVDLLASVKGVDVDAVDIYGYTPLLSAGICGNVECARALLAAGADVHATGDGERTILHYLKGAGSVEDMTNLAESYGFHFERTDAKGNTPLLHAAKNENVHAMRALAKAGANVEAYNKKNKGVMRYAAKARRHMTEMVEIALYHGADWDFLNEREGPLDLRLFDERGEKGRLVRNKLLEAAGQLSREKSAELLKRYWPSCDEIVRNGNFRDFRDLSRKATEAYLMNDVPKMIENDGDLINLLSEYELKGAFALFKILKTIYAKKEPATELERRKFEIFDYAVAKITESTYLATLPVELTSDILLRSTFYGWKLETTSFHLALAFDALNVSLDRVKKAMAEIIFNY